jgi:hypothetical protein
LMCFAISVCRFANTTVIHKNVDHVLMMMKTLMRRKKKKNFEKMNYYIMGFRRK